MTAINQKPIIAVDIDDVLAANAQSFVTFSNQRWGTRLTIDDYDEHWGQMWQVDHDEAERRAQEYFASGTMGRYELFSESLPVLKWLSQRYSLVIVTSRRALLTKETDAWVRQYLKGIFDKVVYAGMWDKPTIHSHKQTKAEALKEIGADYLIDDQLKHCEAAAAAGIQALLFGDYKWNHKDKLSDGIVRVKDWVAVKEYFQKCN